MANIETLHPQDRPGNPASPEMGAFCLYHVQSTTPPEFDCGMKIVDHWPGSFDNRCPFESAAHAIGGVTLAPNPETLPNPSAGGVCSGYIAIEKKQEIIGRLRK